MALTQSQRAAEEYSRLPDVERCVVAARLLRDTWYSYVYRPDLYEQLEAERRALRPEQIPAWVYADIDDPSRIPEMVRREDQNAVQTQVMCGGRGAGKGHSGAVYFAEQMLGRPGFRLTILGPKFTVSMGVDIKGDSGIVKMISAIDPSLIARIDEQKNILYLVNGSMAFARSAESPGSIEGENYHAIWVDEPAELWRQGGDECVYRKRAEPGVRLKGPNGEPVRKLITGTPDTTPLILDLHKSTEDNPRRYAWSTLSTKANLANLDEGIVEDAYARSSPEYIQAKLEGILLLESPNALVTQAVLAKTRKAPGEKEWLNPEDLDELFVAVDSNHSDDKKSDECGIIIGGAKGGTACAIADATIKGGPELWGERVVEVLIAFPEINTILIEDDKSLVLKVVRQLLDDRADEIGRHIKIEPMHHMNRDKKARADPVALLYHRGKVVHCQSPRVPAWTLQGLETQWTSWNPIKSTWSPDRIDACVYLFQHAVLAQRAPDSFFAPSDVKWA